MWSLLNKIHLPRGALFILALLGVSIITITTTIKAEEWLTKKINVTVEFRTGVAINRLESQVNTLETIVRRLELILAGIK